MTLHPLQQEPDWHLLALAKEQEAEDEQRYLRPLRDRVTESVLLALTKDREYRETGSFPPDHNAVMNRALQAWMDDPVFHALVTMTVNQILRDAELPHNRNRP